MEEQYNAFYAKEVIIIYTTTALLPYAIKQRDSSKPSRSNLDTNNSQTWTQALIVLI